MIQAQGYVDPALLKLIADLLAQTKQRSYGKMLLQPHHKVLDIGCGPGTDTIPLARLIGSTGEVVGVDYDEAMVTEAKKRAEQAGVNTWTTHIKADVTLDRLKFRDNYFDSSRCERLFQHISNPERALLEMVRVTKRNGWVVVLDTDWGTLSVDTPEIDIERRLARVMAEQVIMNGYSGRHLYALFRKQNLTNITIEMFPTHITNYSLLRQIMLMDRTEKAALEARIITKKELDQWHSTLEQADAAGMCFGGATLVMAVGQKS
jgi:ubiquinone/menaquinone biosynthesis C-methylase UbiE